MSWKFIPPPHRRTVRMSINGTVFTVTLMGTFKVGRDPMLWPRMKDRAARRRAGYTRTGGRR